MGGSFVIRIISMPCIATLCGVLLAATSSSASAQTTSTVNPSQQIAEPAAKEDVPVGGCMPIGLTASGEIVFPMQCKELIEREHGKSVTQSALPTENTVAKEPEVFAPVNSKPADQSVEGAAKSVARNSRRDRVVRSDDCTKYRTFDAASRTYRGYDGRRRSCRE